MNVRRIVMMMLVLVCLVQGVSAVTYIAHLEAPAGPCFGGAQFWDSVEVDNNYTGTYFDFYYWHSGDINTSGNYNIYVKSSGGGLNVNNKLPVSGSLLVSGGPINVLQEFDSWDVNAGVTCDTNSETIVYAISTTLYTTESPSIASGESCDGTGSFTVYMEEEYLLDDSADGNYSFTIFDGVDYQIHYEYGNISEWHNFTASGDESWDPSSCTLPSISGTITALDGEGIYNLNVTLHDFYIYERDLIDSTTTDANGSYVLYVNQSDDVGPYALSVSGYCDQGADCYAFRIEAPINPGDESYVFDYTWQLPQNIRVKLEYENSSAVSGALLSMKDLPANSGVWKTTATDGYTTYSSMQSSKIYLGYHGGDVGEEGSTEEFSFQLTPDGQYRQSQFTLTLPDDFQNNTTIPPVPPVVDDSNLTDITNMTTDSVFLVTVVDAENSAPLKDVTVTAVAADRNYTGQFTGFTNASGQYSFSKNNSVGQYDVSVALTCYIPQTKSRYSSASFDLEYSCGEQAGTDENGTGGWQGNDSYSNWTFNNSMETENDVKNKFNSFLYTVGVISGLVLFATYFVKK